MSALVVAGAESDAGRIASAGDCCDSSAAAASRLSESELSTVASPQPASAAINTIRLARLVRIVDGSFRFTIGSLGLSHATGFAAMSLESRLPILVVDADFLDTVAAQTGPFPGTRVGVAENAGPAWRIAKHRLVGRGVDEQALFDAV